MSVDSFERDMEPAEAVRARTQGAGLRFGSPRVREEIAGRWKRGMGFNLCLFEIEHFYAYESLYGPEEAERLLEQTSSEVAQAAVQKLGGRWHVTGMLDPGKFFVLFGGRSQNVEECADMALSLRMLIRSGLKREALKRTGQGLDLTAGCARVARRGAGRLETALYNALRDARRMAAGLLDSTRSGLLREFRAIVDGDELWCQYQPIVDLGQGGIHAWEALARGPESSCFQRPDNLFDFAEEEGEIFHLERACRRTAIAGFGAAAPGQRLFLNVHPKTLMDPAFTPGQTVELLASHGLAPKDVVFEITERHSIRDFSLFHTTLAHYRQQGFRVAVDDVGSGYSGLWSIAELRPDYIKIDMSLVRGIDVNPVKRALLETFVAFSEKIGCKIIAEGIETETELSTLASIGVQYGQGFYLARPAFPKPRDVAFAPSLTVRGATGSEAKCSIPVRELAEPAHAEPTTTRVRRLKELMDVSEALHAVVVVDGKKPVGLVMSHHMDRALSMRYGMSLFYDRDLTNIMDAGPLIVDAGDPVEKAARMAMGRDRLKLYDNVIVTEGGELFGTVSVQKMLDTMAQVQVEVAKGANPLSGLPGNVAIEQEIERRMREGQPFSIIYSDLDNFKIYNDLYGFKKGDDIILLIAKVLSWAARRHGGLDSFVGHVGGDDLVVVARPERAERLCRAVTRCFGRLVPHHYSNEDRRRGHVRGVGRDGNECEVPLVSVSLAIVDCNGTCSLADLAHRSAEMKKVAKQTCGNVWRRDRRTPLGQCGEAPRKPAE